MSSIPHRAPYASGAHPPVPIGEGIGENGEGFSSTGEPTGEGIGAYHDPLADTLASIRDRLAVVAVAAHIMERRAPRDCYARSIARETQALALAMRELHREASSGAPVRAPRIVDAAPDTSPDATPASPSSSPDAAPDGKHDARELCSFPGCCHWYNDPCADCLEVERGADRGATSRGSSRRSTTRKPRQTPPDARQRATGAQASGCDAHSHARRKGSLAASDGASDEACAEGGAQ